MTRSPSQAVKSPHSISRTENPASHRDILSLCASNDDEFNNSPSEDDQDLAPDPEMTNVSKTHSEASSGKQMSFLEGTGQDLQLIWRYRRSPKRASPCPNQGDP